MISTFHYISLPSVGSIPSAPGDNNSEKNILRAKTGGKECGQLLPAGQWKPLTCVLLCELCFARDTPTSWTGFRKSRYYKWKLQTGSLWFWSCVLNGMSFKKKMQFLHLLFYLVGWGWAWGHMPWCVCVEIFLPSGSWGLDSVHQLGSKHLFLSHIVGLGWALHCGGLAILGDALTITPYLLPLKGPLITLGHLSEMLPSFWVTLMFFPQPLLPQRP